MVRNVVGVAIAVLLLSVAAVFTLVPIVGPGTAAAVVPTAGGIAVAYTAASVTIVRAQVGRAVQRFMLDPEDDDARVRARAAVSSLPNEELVALLRRHGGDEVVEGFRFILSNPRLRGPEVMDLILNALVRER